MSESGVNFGLDDDKSKSRYSLSYLYAVCAQAGALVSETPQYSDVHTVDGTIAFDESFVRVPTQVLIDEEDGQRL